jgi:hypothetical protein
MKRAMQAGRQRKGGHESGAMTSCPAGGGSEPVVWCGAGPCRAGDAQQEPPGQELREEGQWCLLPARHCCR